MKKFLIVLSIMVLLGTMAICYAQQTQYLGFTWTANTEADLAGYRLYASDTAGSYTFGDPNVYIAIDPNSTAFMLSMIPTTETYFVLTAVDAANNESGPSNEVMFDPVAPAPPQNFIIQVIISTSQ